MWIKPNLKQTDWARVEVKEGLCTLAKVAALPNLHMDTTYCMSNTSASD